MEYKTVEQARNLPGMRLVLTAGVPGPWGEAAKSILAYKKIPFVAVAQEGGGENDALREWTGQTSAPVAVYEDLPPVSHWLDLLMLAERLAPARPLVPDAAAPRAEVLGLSALVAGVDGFGWNRRLQMLAPMMAMQPPPEQIARLAWKYGWSDAAAAAASARLVAILGELDRRLAAQAEQGSEFLVGDAVSAVDFYWANFAAMVRPLGPEVNPMPDYLRDTYANTDANIDAALSERLLAHRDMMYERFITLPLDF